MKPARPWLRYFLAFALTTTPLAAQSIFTYAGGGPIGDGGLATQAILNSPMDIVVDASGNLYILDWRHKVIRKVTAATGIITTIAGGGTSGDVLGGAATLTEFRDPWKIAVDAAGDVFVSDRGTKIYRVDGATGVVTLFASTTYSVIGIAADSGGNLYVADRWNHLVRRIDALTRAITIVAGGGSPADGYGDGGLATAARLYEPEDVAISPIAYGNYLYIAERGTTSPAVDGRIRRVDLSTGNITTWGGGGASKPATGLEVREVSFSRTVWPYNTLQDIAVGADGHVYLFSGGSRGSLWKIEPSHLIFPETRIMTEIPDPGYYGLSVDASSNLYTVNKNNHVAWKLQSPTWSQSIVAGSTNIGDGRIATAAELSDPSSVAVDTSGRILVLENAANRIRRIDPVTHLISTLVTSSSLASPASMAVDASNNIYVTSLSRIMKVNAADLSVSAFAGTGEFGFTGDEGLAVNATFSGVLGIARDSSGNTYVADSNNHRIRRIDAVTGIVTTYAGSGPYGGGIPGSYCGDGGLAISACLNRPEGIALNAAGDLFIADFANYRVRKVAAGTGIITTVSGTGNPATAPVSTGQIATATNTERPMAVYVDASGNLVISDAYSVYRVNSSTSVITTLAGIGQTGFTGDGGPATNAKTSVFGVTSILETGNRTFLTDQGNARVRVVPKCTAAAAPVLNSPAYDAAGVSLAPTLVWSESANAFSYDVYLGTTNPPTTVVAPDIASKAFFLSPVSGTISFTPANLQQGTTYYWKIVAKGDRFCSPQTTASSAVQWFTTTGVCGAPGTYAQSAPTDGSSVSSTSVLLSWSAATGASSYDVYAGTSNPPPKYATTTATSLSVTSLVANSTYYWYVVAHASCDTTLTRATSVRSFTVTGVCKPPGSFAITSPANGAPGVATTATLQWSASTDATTYDLYLGTTSPPPLFQSGITGTSKAVAGLVGGTLYYWQVIARVACSASYNSSTALSSFTTAGTCVVPTTPAIAFSPPGPVSIGQSYVIAWNPVTGLDEAGQYVVERSTSSTFSPILDTQRTRNTSASFIASSAVPHYHRVRAVPFCDAANASANSSTVTVTVNAEAPNVIFTVQPKAVLSHIGQNIEDVKATFTIENISSAAVTVDIPRAEVGGSIPFFRVADPGGGDVVNVTLQPRVPKSFDIQFAGPSNSTPGSYQGIVYVVKKSGTALPVIPYAFVNLKVGDEAGAQPSFYVGGVAATYAAFPPFDGVDDSARAPLEVEIHNPGSSLAVGGEVGPELWLQPEADWNTNPIPAGAFRVIRLYSKRSQAPNGASFTRATYFTVRTSDGRSARLLVQDNDPEAVGSGRLEALDPRARSIIVPDARSNTSAMSVLTLTNVGSDVLPVQVIFTPADSDGFSSVARFATVTVPANDVVTITDPITQLFGLPRPASGQLELRVAESKLGLLLASATIVEATSVDSQIASIPLVPRGIGARSGAPHQLIGVTQNATLTSDLVLAETTGIDGAEVSVSLFNSSGTLVAEGRRTLLRYGQTRIANVVTSLGAGSTLELGRIHISVVSGAGTVAGVLEASNGTHVAAIASEPLVTTGGAGKAALRQARGLPPPTLGSVALAVAIPFAATGTIDSSSASTYRTVLGLAAPWGGSATFSITFANSNGTTSVNTVGPIGPGASTEYPNVLHDLFGIEGSARGSLRVEATPSGSVYARLVDGVETVAGFPIVEMSSEQAVSAATSVTPIHLDGLEQSIDPSRGRRWNVYLTEIGGGSGTVTVRLYEAANRNYPLVQQDFSILPNQQFQFETIFRALGLETALRSKDRTGVLCVVTPKSGNAVVTAAAVAIENESGAAMSYVFDPGNGLPFSTVQAVSDAPSITSFTPTTGLPGTPVTITGTRFSNVVGVSFAGTAATYSIVSSTQITTTVPTSASTGRITLTSLSGPGTSATDFTVPRRPTISGFTPSQGGAGTIVTISGTAFTGASAVAFNGVSATFTVSSDTQITATVPAGAATGAITVTTPGGVASSSSNFTFVPAPAIAAFTPTSGARGTSVTISGSNFTNASAVTFAGVTASFSVNGATQITATVPPEATTGRISVTTPGGTATSASDFTVVTAPAITSFAPTSGPVASSVTITGVRFTGATSVTFNGVAASFSVISDSQITTSVPFGATTGPISVTTPAGSGSSAANFTVLTPPVITSFSPTSGVTGTPVTISGSGFTGATSVLFNGVTSIFAVNSPTQISAAVPAGATSGVIAVTTPGGSAASNSAFIVVTPPHITSFSPAAGVVGALVAINGGGFIGTTSVKFGGADAAFSVVSNERISATVPDTAVTGLICVTTPVGSACSAGSFTITTSAQRGDLNGDGGITAADVVFLINALFSGGSPPASGDVNGDSKVNVEDVFYLINYLFAGGPAPVT